MLAALSAAGLLNEAETATLNVGYSFLRLVEARLRIVTDRPLTEIPDSPGRPGQTRPPPRL